MRVFGIPLKLAVELGEQLFRNRFLFVVDGYKELRLIL
jgi:hypothetical protein